MADGSRILLVEDDPALAGEIVRAPEREHWPIDHVQSLGEAFEDLVCNAVAHGGGAGQIMVVVGTDRTLDVIDGGPGVPPGLQARLFEPGAHRPGSEVRAQLRLFGR